MGRQFNKLVVAIVAPPLRVAGAMVGNLYSLFFGWYDKRLARRAQQAFAEAVLEQLSFLFTDYDAQIVLKPEIKRLSEIDWPSVTLSTDGMLFKFLLQRGDLSASIAPIHKPNDWDDLLLVLSLIDESVKREGVVDLSYLARLLKPRMMLLSRAFSEDTYAATKQHLSEAHEYDRVVTRQWENEVNRRLYP
jgi:hypothetical protein